METQLSTKGFFEAGRNANPWIWADDLKPNERVGTFTFKRFASVKSTAGKDIPSIVLHDGAGERCISRFSADLGLWRGVLGEEPQEGLKLAIYRTENGKIGAIKAL